MLRGTGTSPRIGAVVVAALLAVASTAGSQEVSGGFTPEIRPFVGVYVPTGPMQDQFKSASMAGIQMAVEMSRNFHVLGSVGWTHGHSKLPIARDRTDIWQYDVGVEANLVRPLDDVWLLRPFAGIGAGGRTYDYRAPGIGSQRCTAGYGSLGTEVQRGDVAFRLEGRDYLSCFESPVTGRKSTLNDVGISFGLAYHIR
jgi:hypothetical protein